jgi:hypothetical protein
MPAESEGIVTIDTVSGICLRGRFPFLENALKKNRKHGILADEIFIWIFPGASRG